MAEYYTVLKKAIGGVDSNARRAVYDKARNALIGQLKAVDPPLTTAEISRQRLELEEAIRKVEREAAANPAPARAPARPAAPPPAPSPVRMAPVPMPASEPVEDSGPSPQDVFRRAIQEAESRGSAAGAAAGAIERAAVAMRAEANQYGGAATDLRPPRERIIERALPAPMPRDEPPVDDYDTRGRDSRERDSRDRDSRDRDSRDRDSRDRDSRDRDDRERPPAEPRLAPEYAQDWDNRGGDVTAVDRRDRPNLPARRKRGYLEEDDREVLEREARPSRLPSFLLTILIIAVIGGGGALAWSKRAVLGEIIASFDGKKAGKSKIAPAVADAGAPSKANDRLLDSQTPATRAVRAVDPPADDAAAPAEPASSPPASAAAAPTDAGESPEAHAGVTADEASPSSPAAPLVASANDSADGQDTPVAQKAFLYEENGGGDTVGIDGMVTWRYVENSANGPEIEGEVQVPERKMKIKLTIHKNFDSGLPASHLIEILFDAPPDQPGKTIAKVARVVLKPTEDARGQPLVGIDAKITDGFYWIALSAVEADLSANLALLRERQFIDLAFVYQTGQRAILSLDKGTPGERIFHKALAAWGSG